MTAAEVQQRRIERDERAMGAFDRRENDRIGSDIVACFVRHGFGHDEGRAAEARVEVLLTRDRAWRATERLREIAQQQVEQGEYANIRDAVFAPLPEQFAQADRDGAGFGRFTPPVLDGTVRTVTAWRRRDVPQAYKAMLAGTIGREGLQACVWYRNLFESTGLSGNIPSTDYGKEVFVSPASHGPFTDRHIETQDTWRFVRSRIDRKALALLDAMLLEDVPIWRAARTVGTGWRTAQSTFVAGIDQLIDARDELREP